jgi:hypothetical protein
MAGEALASAAQTEAAGQKSGGLLLGRPPPGSPAILGSHPLIYTAEGEMYREALRGASAHVAVVGFREREIEASRSAEAAPDCGRDRRLGKPLGPPGADESARPPHGSS